MEQSQKKKRATLKDLEKATGLSVATVSRAISGKGYVSQENLEIIKKAQQELNYSPRKKGTDEKTPPKMILLSLPNNNSPFWLDYMKGIQAICKKMGYYPLLVYSDVDEKEEVNIIKAVDKMQVAGLIVVTIDASYTLCKALQSLSLPRVLCAVHAIDTDEDVRNYDCISIDSRRGVTMATRHLAQQGCSDIAYIGITRSTVNGAARLSGYLEAMQQLNLPVKEDRVRLMEDWECEENGYQSVRDFYAAGKMPDGIVCLNDRAAVGALLACHELNISIPEQVKLIGMDNTDMTNYVTPTLSSVDIAPFELASNSAKMLFNRINQRGGLSQNTVLTPRLVVRKSSVVSSDADTP